MAHVLDNPIWESLQTHHAQYALRDKGIGRYPREVGPFLGMSAESAGAPASLANLMIPGEVVYFIQHWPALDEEYEVHRYDLMPQLVCETRLNAVAGPEITVLTNEHHADMLALTGLVYPGYFRQRTPEIGNYIGIYQDGKLAAMAGERMRCHQYQEMSAICTHPDFLGRGYAQRLLAILTNRTLDRGVTPFLHVDRANTRARSVYDRLGYQERAALPFASVTRLKTSVSNPTAGSGHPGE
jgi:ribosomal protein S18 acetylase RimI-like enzyme